MIQQHMRMPAGSFSLCRCGYEPRYYQVRGRSKLETGRGADVPPVRHMLECRCGRATAKHATLLLAEAEWGPVLSKRPLALPAPALVVPMRRRSARREAGHG